MKNRIKLFTHVDLDGIGCVVLAYLEFGRENVDVEYCDYKNVDEKVKNFVLDNDQSYDAIYITDISVNEEVAQVVDNWVAKNKVRLFDHHDTALWLNKYDWCDVKVCDESGVKTSGTSMFYVYLCSEVPAPNYNVRIRSNIRTFSTAVRDYDTWRWKELGNAGLVCKQLNDLFGIYGRDKFIEWATDNILEMDKAPYFTENDRALLGQKQRDIDIYIAHKDKQLTSINDKFGHTCGVVFAERYFSELGNKLCELHPELDYITMVDISKGLVSYRTVRDDIDLGGEIAHSFGGGGHRKAAGSTFDAKDIGYIVLGNIFEREAAVI